MNPFCPKCGARMRRLINPMGYWCPECNKIIKDALTKKTVGSDCFLGDIND